MQLLQRLVAGGRVILGMSAFLLGFLLMGGGAVGAVVGAMQQLGLLLARDPAASFIDRLVAAALGAWIGALVFVVGFVALWVARKLDDRGPVRSYSTAPKRAKTVRRPLA